jgi:hypothetical protein
VTNNDYSIINNVAISADDYLSTVHDVNKGNEPAQEIVQTTNRQPQKLCAVKSPDTEKRKIPQESAMYPLLRHLYRRFV